MKFELLVAVRYLRAKRKQAVISLITIISIVGVAAGVAALIIAMAIETGFREDLQQKLLGAQADISLLPSDPTGIADYLNLTKQTEKVPGVVAAAPALYENVLISGKNGQPQGAELKGVIPEFEDRVSTFSRTIVQGDLKTFDDQGIIIGLDLANALGTSVGETVQVLSLGTTLSPFGPLPANLSFRVVAIFSSGLFELDSKWAYVRLDRAQRLLRSGDVVGTIEVKVAKVDDARIIGQQIVRELVEHHLQFEDWMSLNKSIFQALQLERAVMFITIGLIVLVASLNIVAMLIMMVLEKTRDIAILMSMGATQGQIRRIFILQGVIIGIVGTAIGVTLGNVLSFVADKYKLVRLPPEVYTISYVPFQTDVLWTVIVAAVAILVSFLATLYPSAAASRLHPVEALRYE